MQTLICLFVVTRADKCKDQTKNKIIKSYMRLSSSAKQGKKIIIRISYNLSYATSSEIAKPISGILDDFSYCLNLILNWKY